MVKSQIRSEEYGAPRGNVNFILTKKIFENGLVCKGVFGGGR